MVLCGSWKKLRSLKLSLCLKVGTPKGSFAERFDVSRSVVARLWRRYQETGEFY